MIFTTFASATILLRARKDAVRIAVNAGIDMSMVPSSWDFCIYLRELVEEGQVSMERIDDAGEPCAAPEIPSWPFRKTVLGYRRFPGIRQ